MKVFTATMEPSMEGIIGLKLEEEGLYGIIHSLKIGQLVKKKSLVQILEASQAFQILNLHALIIPKMIGNIMTKVGFQQMLFK